jgi:Ca2+-binding RTX toxin-like protein
MADVRSQGTFVIGTPEDDLVQGYNAPSSPGDLGQSQILTGFDLTRGALYALTFGSTSVETYKETETEVPDGNDAILGGQGDDALLGGGGNDRLIGGAASLDGNNDTLYGG